MDEVEFVVIEVDRIVHETDSAFLLLIDDEKVWIPKSQVEDPDSYSKGDCDLTMNVTEWIAKEKELVF